ncbi:hypothetical protein AKJ42_03205 [candidate division MSBL1 archaeon SCGC-AAA261C02]|uniref:Uncharacterized protein n=1 Tax=candidate division MSBL1 archaeon SCGC-AAA261C02 TaxID=1698272 RepID=A0A133UZ14_9EURY|nr:hypothetical protein AKJ42_03205 [candidate division MSBL1 archaeon SCGC-AAA261C02]
MTWVKELDSKIRRVKIPDLNLLVVFARKGKVILKDLKKPKVHVTLQPLDSIVDVHKTKEGKHKDWTTLMALDFKNWGEAPVQTELQELVKGGVAQVIDVKNSKWSNYSFIPFTLFKKLDWKKNN